jgi:6-phosphogluconolactonase
VIPFAAVNPAGTLLYLAAGEITTYSIDATTGALTSVSNTGLQNEATGFAVNRTGSLAYATDGASVYAYSVNNTTGALTQVAGSPFSTGGSVDLIFQDSQLIAFDQTDGYLYVANRFANNNISAFSIDSSTGALTRIAGTPVGVTTSINGRYTLVTVKIP